MESLGTFRKCIESQCCARRRSISVVSSSLQVTVEPNNQTNIVQMEQRFRRQDHMPAFHHHELLHIWIFSLSCPNNKKQSLDILDLFVPHWRSSIERKISPRLSASMPVTAFVLRGVDVSFSPTAVVYMKSNRENWIRDALYGSCLIPNCLPQPYRAGDAAQNKAYSYVLLYDGGMYGVVMWSGAPSTKNCP